MSRPLYCQLFTLKADVFTAERWRIIAVINDIIMKPPRKNNVPCPRSPICELSMLIPAAMITFNQNCIYFSEPNVKYIPSVGINPISIIIDADSHFGNLYEIEHNNAPNAAIAE